MTMSGQIDPLRQGAASTSPLTYDAPGAGASLVQHDGCAHERRSTRRSIRRRAATRFPEFSAQFRPRAPIPALNRRHPGHQGRSTS
jgi:hypothetical protein